MPFELVRVNRHLQASHPLGNGSQNPSEARGLKCELELDHQEIARLKKEVEKQAKGEVRLVLGAEVPQLQNENKLLAETLAALKKEKQAKEDEFTERNSGLNNKLNTALAK